MAKGKFERTKPHVNVKIRGGPNPKARRLRFPGGSSNG